MGVVKHRIDLGPGSGLQKDGEPWEPGSMKAIYLTGSFEALSIISMITVETSTKRSPLQLIHK